MEEVKCIHCKSTNIAKVDTIIVADKYICNNCLKEFAVKTKTGTAAQIIGIAGTIGTVLTYIVNKKNSDNK